jgi:hypothetical protein
MILVLCRSTPIGEALPGELTVNGEHAAWTLERVAVAIPSGYYEVKLYDSPHFGRLMPWLQVPRREYVLMHWGNYPQNSDGCILVGETQDPSTGDIFNTQKKFNELFPAIESAVEGEGCHIAVWDYQPLSNIEQVRNAATGEN